MSRLKEVNEIKKIIPVLEKMEKYQYRELLNSLDLGLPISNIRIVRQQCERIVRMYKTRYSHIER
tara:strand:+ start:7031 stop:7225 length:195 start_codon:yes stop_codon:yes gene_type:complete